MFYILLYYACDGTPITEYCHTFEEVVIKKKCLPPNTHSVIYHCEANNNFDFGIRYYRVK